MLSSMKAFASSNKSAFKDVFGRGSSSGERVNFAESGRTDECFQRNSMEFSSTSFNESGQDASGIREIRSSRAEHRKSFSSASEKPKISSWDAGWNVTNSIQGMFVLGLPYAIVYGGYLGLLLIVLTAIICCYTGEILVHCLYEKSESGEIIRVRETYFDVASACWGRRFGGSIVNVTQLIELLMTCVLYIVVAGNLMSSSFPNAPINEAGWSTIATLILTPCILLKNLRAVSKLSMGCSVAQAVVIVITIIYCMSHITTWAWSEISLSIDGSAFPVSIGVIVFSYTSQIFLPSLEGSMEDRTSFKKMLYWSYGAACSAKFFFALICFLTWSYNTKEVVTDNLPAGLRTIISMVLVVKALLSYPLPYYAAVEVLEQTVFTGATGGLGSLLKTKAHPYDDLSNSSSLEFSPDLASPDETHNNNQVRRKPSENTHLKSITNVVIDSNEQPPTSCLPSCYTPDGELQHWGLALRLTLICGTYIVALFIPHFALLMGLTGSLTGASLAFVFPCAFYLQLRWNVLNWKQISLNVTIIIVGLVCCVSGIYHSLQGLYLAYNPVEVISSSNLTVINGTLNATLTSLVNATSMPLQDLILFNEPGPLIN